MSAILKQYPIKTKKEALEIVGGLSSPGKMPGYGWSISAKRCKRGSKMQKVSGSTCSHCYAMKGRYSFDNVQQAQERRLANLEDPRWESAMIFLLKDEEYFRWFDSGDLQNVDHLDMIVRVCNNTPNCKHWLPTREFSIVKEYLQNNTIPSNLVIRLSSDFVDKRPIREFENCQISTTSTNKWINDNEHPNAHECPVASIKSVKTCDEAKCKSCWDKTVYHINYKIH